jgi:hypothetical protein
VIKLGKKNELLVTQSQQSLLSLEKHLDSIPPLGFLAKDHAASVRELSKKFQSRVRGMLLARTGCTQNTSKILTHEDLVELTK